MAAGCDDDALSTTPWRDWPRLTILFLAVLALRGWILCHTEVTARDSIGYIRYALEFDKLPWHAVAAKNHQHPGYSLCVWLVSLPVRAVMGPADPDSMRVCAQLVSALASLLLIFPMYYLGKKLLDGRVAFWAVLLFQFLPVTGHHLSDGISEGLFILLLTTGLLLAAQALETNSWLRFAGCGVFCGLAFFTRPEGGLLLAATGMVLVGMQCLKGRRRPARAFFACGLSLTLAAVLVGGMYVWATGRLSNKVFVNQLLETMQQRLFGQTPGPKIPALAKHDSIEKQSVTSSDCCAGPSFAFRARWPLFASLWAAHLTENSQGMERLLGGVRALAMELNQCFHYLATVPLLLGLWWQRQRLSGFPGWWVMVVLCLIHGAVLIRLAMGMGYISDRHVMVIVLCGCYLAAAGLGELPGRLLALGSWLLAKCNERRAESAEPSGTRAAPRRAALVGACSVVLLTGMIAVCLPKTLQPLHGNRAGNHAAGLWLAPRLQNGDVVEDDHNWSHYYSGLVFREGQGGILPAEARPICYWVMTRSRDRDIDQARKEVEAKLAAHGQMVYRWPEDADVDRARVVVFAVPRDPHTHPWPQPSRHCPQTSDTGQ